VAFVSASLVSGAGATDLRLARPVRGEPELVVRQPVAVSTDAFLSAESGDGRSSWRHGRTDPRLARLVHVEPELVIGQPVAVYTDVGCAASPARTPLQTIDLLLAGLASRQFGARPLSACGLPASASVAVMPASTPKITAITIRRIVHPPI
jgi:hypothetical protein